MASGITVVHPKTAGVNASLGSVTVLTNGSRKVTMTVTFGSRTKTFDMVYDTASKDATIHQLHQLDQRTNFERVCGKIQEDIYADK